jgi:hypothetical protein
MAIEEPVVAKTSRVVEEVVVGKQVAATRITRLLTVTVPCLRAMSAIATVTETTWKPMHAATGIRGIPEALGSVSKQLPGTVGNA